MEDIALDPQLDAAPVRSAHMNRRPEEREVTDDEDKSGDSAAWMVQQDAPHEAAEDPFGLQRPVDRDDQTSAEEYGDMLSEVASARQVAAPEPAREVLLSDDPPQSRAVLAVADAADAEISFRYPEWDCTSETYREQGVTVRIQPPSSGAQDWVDATLSRHRTGLDGIRRQFEAVRPERLRLRRQTDGDDIDLDACVEARADLLAGGFLREALYEMRRPGLAQHCALAAGRRQWLDRLAGRRAPSSDRRRARGTAARVHGLADARRAIRRHGVLGRRLTRASRCVC